MSDQKAAEELQAELEAANARLQELSASGDLTKEQKERLAHLESENKELIAARDKAKEAKRLAEEARLAEQGEYKTLAEQRQEEADKLAKDVEEKNALLETYKARDEAEFAALLEQVPDTLKETVSDPILPLGKRLELAKKLIAEKPAAPAARVAGELTTDSLDDQYRKAVELGDVALQISLKRQIHEANQ